MLAAGALFFSISGAAWAQTYVDEYKAYMQALESGDSEAAVTHGYAAWRKAEEALGDNNLTAVLAYNYGQLVLFSDNAGALAALERADELRASGVADLPQIDLDLYLAFARLNRDNNNRKSRNALRDALDAYTASGGADTEDTSRMWLALANAEMLAKRYSDAFETAKRAEQAILSATPDDYPRRADAMTTQGISLVANPKTVAQDLLAANQIFVRASGLFPVQTSVRNFDPKLAVILAWNGAAAAKFRTVSAFQQDAPETHKGSHVKLAEPHESEFADPEQFHAFDLAVYIKREMPEGGCGAGEMIRTPPRYPDYALRKGFVGTAVVGYDLDAYGGVINPVVLAEAPVAAEFSRLALEAMANWRMTEKPINQPGCLKDLITYFSFQITG